MTAQTITPTCHLRSRADQLADRIEAGEVLDVTLEERSPGWYVVGVDRLTGRLTVRRDGVEKTVTLSQVSE